MGAVYQFDCGTYEMPLDRTGAVPGTTTVRATRQPATEGPRMGTIFVIAGGPGQGSEAMLDLMNSLFAGANRYDIIAVDQRGSGYSEPLNCPRIESGSFKWDGANPATDGPFTNCSNSLGPARAAYNTFEAVEDLETIRADLGIDTATFFGISYGTKVALAYAKAHPSHTKALLLDSILPTDKPSAFDTDSLAALRGALTRICSAKRCKGVGNTPVANATMLAARLAKEPEMTYLISPTGKLSLAEIDAVALYDIVFQADLNPFIYNQIPGTLSSALAGNSAQLQRLFAIVNGSFSASSSLAEAKRIARVARSRKQSELDRARMKRGQSVHGRDVADLASFSSTMFFATTCADFVPPWTRGSDLSGRQATIESAAAAIPSSQFIPFSRATAAADSTAAFCRGWHQNPALPAINQGPLPDVPTLALSGTLDLRTPGSWAHSTTAADPRAQVIDVPNTGHSSIGTDLSGCALSLAKRFLIYGGTDGKCKDTAPAIPIAPSVKRTISGVPAAKGGCRRISGSRCKRVLKVLTAGYLALRDTLDQVLIGGSDVGPGLYDGSWEIEYDIDDSLNLLPTDLSMSGVSNVPGVYVSGLVGLDDLPRVSTTLRMGGYRVTISGKVSYDRTGDSLTFAARRGRTSAHIRIRPSGRAASAKSPTRARIALRRNYTLAAGAPSRPAGR